MTRTHAALAALLALTVTGTAHAATVTNGSFEEPANFSANWRTLGAGSSALTGWTIGGKGIDHINTGWTASDGKYSIDLNAGGAGAISQKITDLEVGKRYTLSFDMAGNSASGPAVKTVSVSLGNAFSDTFKFDTTGQSFGSPKWDLRSATFTATETSAILSFVSPQNNAYGAALDNIRLSEALSVSAVPLPAGAVFLASGLGALALRRRARG